MERVLDQQGRWRNKVVAFRMSPEEDEVLEAKVKLSGLTKQEYIIRRLTDREITVVGNPRVYKALRGQMDFDLDKGLLSITKSYQRLKGRDVITDPKTPKSVRVIQMPQFLTDEIRDYLKSLYKVQPDQRIFEVTKSYLHHEMDRGAKAAGVKRIRIHDLRHSHVSLLIEMGFSALAIADRVGHESVDITYKYAHLFPSKQQEMAQKLDMERREG